MLSMLPTTGVGRKVRDSIFSQAVVSMAATVLISAGSGQLGLAPDLPERRPPSPVTSPAAPTPGPSGSASAPKPPKRDSVAAQARIEHCQSRGPQVWLTFDDGGSAKQITRILRVLKQRHVQAIFFPIGSWAEANTGLVRRIAREGHLIGDHTHDHVDLARAGDKKTSWQIRHGLTHTTGSVSLLRPPFGAGAYTGRLSSIAAADGVRLCTWTVDTRDWAGASAAKIIHRVRYGDALTPRVKSGGVIIMHMNGEHTGRALPGVISAVRARGLVLHTLPR